MPEKKQVFRLFKVAKELNVGSSTLIDHLVEKGFEVNNKPNEKLSGEMYDLLLKDFASEKVLKEKAQQIREQKNEELLSKDDAVVEEEEPISAEDLRSGLLTKEKPAAEKPAAEKPVKKEEPTPKEEKKEAPEGDVGIKVIGRIDLDKVGKTKKKEAPKKEEPKKEEPKKEEPKKEEPKIEESKKEESKKEAPKKEAPVKEVAEKVVSKTKENAPEKVVVEKEETVQPEEIIRAADRTPKLEGLKVMGKIELPKEKEKKEKPKADKAGAKEGDDTASGRRKRRRKRKKGTVVSAKNVRDNKGAKKPDPKKKEEPTDKEIQEQIKQTLAAIDQRSGRSRQKLRRQKRDDDAQKRMDEEQKRVDESHILEVTEFITANEFANLMEIQVTEIITKCMELGLFVSINQRLEADVIQLLAEEFGFQVSFVDVKDQEMEEGVEDELEDINERPPIVTVMGHVDHGKTSLLDFVRDANVIAGEAGGITQHIGAYEVTLPEGKSITFLDTPGHEAFTAMRARGAKVTDLAIIVIAADDAVMPQTKEAINHAQAAGVPMIFALNKMDRDGANPDRIKEQLSQMNILTEDWGGKFQCQEISAKTGDGISDLLEKVLLESELLELKANAEKTARGAVIEAKLDKGRGIVATLLVQNGTLKIGDCLVGGVHFGKVKALMDERGNRIEEAGPAKPAQILGLTGVPQAGDNFFVYDSEKKAKEIATKRNELYRQQLLKQNKHITLDEIARRRAIGNFKELNIVVKGDVDGSIEALSDSLLKISTEEVKVNIIMRAVGQISESDVLLASASDAIIVGFQVRPSLQARKLAENEGIDIRLYSVIYDTINDVKDALEGLLSPEIKEEVMGSVEIREVFKITKVGNVAGCMVVDGTVLRNDPIRLIRDGIVIYTGKLGTLKRFKDDVKEVRAGFECGLTVDGYDDIKVGDIVESYHESEVRRKLE